VIRENHVKRNLQEGKNVIGTFVKIYDPSAVELLGLTGYDFVIIDNEHVAMSREKMVQLIRAADVTGMVPIVRVRENRAVEVLQALDEGALGVMIPQVDTKEEALAAVQSVKYAPLGQRGYAPSHRAAGYGTVDPQEYAKISNEQTLLACYCETVAAVEHLDEILSVSNIDVIFIGPFDLSQSLGYVGQGKHPKVIETIEAIIPKIVKSGKAAGIIASDTKEAVFWMSKGVRYITISSDLGMIASVAKQTIKDWKQMKGEDVS
jgi:4-hydroxy-2-oxoheptanedioate aldolase